MAQRKSILGCAYEGVLKWSWLRLENLILNVGGIIPWAEQSPETGLSADHMCAFPLRSRWTQLLSLALASLQ